jgi:EF-P beta-lysylation protein EpmB
MPALAGPLATAPGTGWQQELADAIRSWPDLLRRLNLPADGIACPEFAAQEFPVLVPESYLRRIRPADWNDPLLRQVIPLADEMADVAGFEMDPVDDQHARKAPGLLHKYQGRALLIAHGSCAIHCRYCFRRHYPYREEPRAAAAWQAAFAAIRDDETLHEIILSGGDPLILSDQRLRQMIEGLAEIPHVRRVRIHSRLPIVLPSRVTSEFLKMLTSTRLLPVMVVHANHAHELVDDCARALQRLRHAGIPLLNQAVLLHRVNDRIEDLAELCERCIDLGVLPYYLHQLDRVRGAAHFQVPVHTGRELIVQLRARLPGYAVPRYVVEAPGASGKTPLECDVLAGLHSTEEGAPSVAWPDSTPRLP